MLQPDWFEPTADEKGFIFSLNYFAEEEDWREWNTTRLVYADWLAERSDAREVIVRAEWKLAGKINRKNGLVFYRWQVTLPKSINTLTCNSRAAMMIAGVLNGYWLLHFSPGSLRLQPPGDYNVKKLRFTHCEFRNPGIVPFDIGAHRDGLLALFQKPKREF